MEDNNQFVETVQELFAQNKHEEAAELLKNCLDEKTELNRQLAESKTLLEVATKELEKLQVESSHKRDCTEFSRGELAAATKDFHKSLMIGGGSYGTVYKGLLRRTTVAIKFLNNEGSTLQEREFYQEVEVLSKIRHPNLVLLIGACPESRALVYDYLPNGSLHSYLFDGKNKNKLPWQERLRIASEICSALICLHSQPIAHGDLKPENVLLDASLVCKLSDFGLSRKLEHSKDTISLIHKTERPHGSLAYIDPVYYSFGELTTKSDIFALGIILLQFVTGRDPRGLRGDVEKEVGRKKFDRLVDTAGKWPSNVALELANLGLECSEQSRNKRPDASYVYDKIESIKNDAAKAGHFKWLPTRSK